MEEKIIRMIGYHGTCSYCRDSIEIYGLDPKKVNYRKDHWLGQGVYFFSDVDKAIWWAENESVRFQNKGSFPIVFLAEIKADASEVLDLDNDSELNLFYDRILESQQKIEDDGQGRYPVFTSEKYRAVFFDYYKETYGISVISYTFSKDCTKCGKIRKSDELVKQRRLAKVLQLQFKEKQICVSKKECIKSISLVYNNEDEVI